MDRLLAAQEMREIERNAIDSGSVTGLELMERAGRGAVDAILTEWPDLERESCRAVVLCGPGNNGGDGFVVARLLRRRGWSVEVYLYGEQEKMAGDARTTMDRWLAGGRIRPLAPGDLSAIGSDVHTDLIVDALFGTGLARAIDLPLSALASGSDLGRRRRVVALDMPSGIHSDSGAILGDGGGSVRADLTLSFHAPKRGHYLDRGPEACGRLRIVDIGLPISGAADHPNPVAPREERGGDPDQSGLDAGAGVDLTYPRSVAKLSGHKYAHGHALVLAGGPGQGGAARLAARGALRIGAGLVTLGCTPAALSENACRLDAIMTRKVRDRDVGAALAQDDRLSAVCIGPGFGPERARRVVPQVLASDRATVLDGDALTAFSDDPAGLFDALHDRCVLTPHGGEFARLFPDISERLAARSGDDLAFSKIDAARLAADRAGCTILLKGPDTVIASPGGAASVNSAAYERAVPWLATAGAGDVLAGFVTGLSARGFSPLDAAATAAWLHVECALAFGPALIAEDLPGMLPKVLSVQKR